MRYTSSHPHAFRNRITKYHRSPRRGRADRDTGAAECRAGADHRRHHSRPTGGIDYTDGQPASRCHLDNAP